MHAWIKNALGVVATVAIAAVAYSSYAALQQWSAAGAALATSVKNLAGTVNKLDATLDHVNHGCAPGPCGTLAQLDKATAKIGDAVVTSQLQVKQTSQVMSAAAKTLASAATDVDGVSSQATATLGQAQKDLKTLNSGLESANTAITGLAPVEKNAATVENHIDAAVQALTPQASRLMTASADSMAEVDGIATDTHKMTTKLEKDVDAPQPWWRKAIPVAGDLTKIGACVASGACL